MLSESSINIRLLGFKLLDFVALCLIYVCFLDSQSTVNSYCLDLGKNVFKIINNFQVVEKMNFILMVKENKLLPTCDAHRFIS